MSALATLFADNILPLMIAAAIGFLLQRLIKIDPKPLSQTVFYALAPCLIFSLLLSSDIPLAQMLRMSLFAVFIIVSIASASYLFSKILKLPPQLAAIFILTASLMNSGNYGLPLTKLALGDEGMAWASLFFITSNLLANSLGVYIATAGKNPPLRALKGLLGVPAIYAILLALLFRFLSLDIPQTLKIPVDLLGSASVPVMLLLLGMHISRSGLPKRKGILALAVGLRLCIAPILGWMFAPAFEFSSIARQAAIIEAATPTAVYTTILASQFDLDPEFASGTILASTILSPLTITPLLYLLGG